ncbi:MAG: ABC transporter permease [Oscillospiraceae bacterium]|nr:ABC transporter permease [Oscillospiraceae bacterium]
MDILNEISLFLQTSVQMGTHILFAIVGGIICERVGNMNLGIEGMMLMGAAVGFSVACATSNPLLAVLAAGAAGMLGALIYAVVTVTFRGNQVVTGLVLTIFGTGVAGFIGKSVSGNIIPENVTKTFAPYKIPVLSDIPIIGKALFDQSIYVQLAIIIAIAAFFYMKKTKWGLNMRAVGENPAAADASGINVTLYKYVHILMGGFLCGIGGAYLSVVFLTTWQDNVTAGAGWIAVALIIFSTWNPLKAILAAYLFGMLKGLNFKMQGWGIQVSSQLLDMIPYAATVIVLIIITLRKKKEYQPPKSLGNPYFREER